MQKVLHFIASHWILVTLFVIAFIWLIIEEAKSKGTLGANLTPQTAVSLINRDNAVVIDTRDADAFATGHIAFTALLTGKIDAGLCQQHGQDM